MTNGKRELKMCAYCTKKQKKARKVGKSCKEKVTSGTDAMKKYDKYSAF
jgi:hypothetical protein